MPETVVVDCSVAAKWILPEPDSEQALQWLEKWEAGEVALIAPDLLLAEFASLLAKRERRKQITSVVARQAFGLMKRCSPRLYDTRLLLDRALGLSLRHQLSLWDCVYAALAVEHDCPFLTADARLFRSGAGRHPSAMRLKI